MAKKQKENNGGKVLTPTERLVQLIRAGYSHFWVYAMEPRRAERTILKVLREFKTKKGEQFDPSIWDITSESSAVECAENFGKLPRMNAIIARNFHWFLEERDEDRSEIIQHLSNKVEECQNPEGRKLFFAITYEKQMPQEVERDFTAWTFDLPDDKILGEALDLICESSGIPLYKGKKRHELITSAKGMAYDQAKNAYALSVVTHEKDKPENRIQPKTVSLQRVSIIEEQSSLRVDDYEEILEELIGLDNVVQYVTKTIPNPMSKGILLIGPTGTGKSHMWKAISNSVNKLMITFSFSKIYGKYYGESEKAINAVIAIIKAIGDCIVFIDEYEKAFAGAGGRGQASGGDVEQRACGEWLKFQQDRPDGIYIAATSNDIDQIPSEYLRSERWDAIFYVPMPSDEALTSILKVYKKHFGVNGTNPDMTGWNGADVRTCCRQACMLGVGVKEGARFVTPAAVIKAEQIATLEAEAEKCKYIRADKMPVEIIEKAKTFQRAIDVGV